MCGQTCCIDTCRGCQRMCLHFSFAIRGIVWWPVYGALLRYCIASLPSTSSTHAPPGQTHQAHIDEMEAVVPQITGLTGQVRWAVFVCAHLVCALCVHILFCAPALHHVCAHPQQCACHPSLVYGSHSFTCKFGSPWVSSWIQPSAHEIVHHEIAPQR